jgi:hypothetical protein
MSNNVICGVDFDNTIVSYDRLIDDEARRRGLVADHGDGKSKKEIRDHIRQLPDGENEWQRVQANIYGPRMHEADLITGVRAFFQACHDSDIRTYIISHKTEYANFDEAGVNLRETALDWMTEHGVFDKSGFGLVKTDVLFGATRQEKITHIKNVGCTHFIDDLEEMFLEVYFPEKVKKILYAPHGQYENLPGVLTASSWQDIYDNFFHATN